MKKNLHVALLFPFLFAVLLASAAFPLVARADDATPPPAEVTPGAPMDPPATAWFPTPTPTWIAPTAEVTLPDAPAMLDGIQTLPEDTTVVVLDSAGAVLPLVTNEAAQIIAEGDPIWCPIGYLPGAPECTSQATITDLIAALGSESGAGTIYFMPTYTTADAVLDHTDPSLMNLTDLTLQGGWNGGTGAGFALSGVTEFTVPLSILNWNGDITLNDLLISNTGSDGLYVTASGDIRVNRLESRGNSGRGAYLNNSSGGPGVEVSVENSSFHDNQAGLDVYSSGDVSLAFMDAHHNLSNGAYIESAGDVTVDDSDFRVNGDYGLGILSAEDVSLSQLLAAQNDNDGTWVIADGRVRVFDATFRDNSRNGLDVYAEDSITLSGVDSSGNDASGLHLVSGQDMLLSDVTANSNENDGAFLQSVNSDITTLCTQFSYNGLYGLEADLPGTLTLDGASFVDNGLGEYAVTGGGTVLQRPEEECALAAPVVKATVTAVVVRTMHIIDVVDGQMYTLDCATYLGTILVLPNRDQVVLPCPITGQASLSSIDLEELPGPLESDLTFLSGMDVLVSPSLDGVILVDFVLPPDQLEANLSILRWDLTEWTELSGIRTTDGFFEARSSRDGVFVLVSR